MAESTGRVTVAQEVISTIVRLTTIGVEGVSRFGGRPGLGRSSDGVHIAVKDNQVEVDVYVIVKPETNMREVATQIQSDIARSIEEMVGMQVSTVNVHIQDVEPPAGK